MLTKLIREFRKLTAGNFARSVSVLIGGTAFSQLIMILILPILTRLYSPQEFNLLSVYAALLGLVSLVACLRLDIAIPIAEKDEDAINLFALAVVSSIFVSIFVGIFVVFYSGMIADLLNTAELTHYLWLLPISILFNSLFNALQYWATRVKEFSFIARTVVERVVGGASIQIYIGLSRIIDGGLIVGLVVNCGIGVFRLAQRLLKQDFELLKAIKFKKMSRLLKEYERFPKYSTFESFFNSASHQLPLLLIASLALGPEVGYLMVAMKVTQAPMAVIGNAIAQVYLSQAPKDYREGRIGVLTVNVIGKLLKTGVGMLFFAGIVAPVAFPIIFGSEWGRAGYLVTWMTPWTVMQFLVSPVSMALQVTSNQRIAMVLQAFGLVLRIGTVAYAGWVAPQYVSEVYSVSGFVFYAIYLFIVIKIVRASFKEIVNQVKSSFIYLLGWIIFGVFIRLGFMRLEILFCL